MLYSNIIFDFDSTLVSVEGIDELARLRGVSDQVEDLTARAMNGEIQLDTVFPLRLDLIKPSTADVQTVAQMCTARITPGARDLISFVSHHCRVFVVTGGYLQVVQPTTRLLGIPDDHVFANGLVFDPEGQFLGLDRSVPLWKQAGKREVVKQIVADHPGRTVVIGDGFSDYEAAQVADAFICFAGVTFREKVSSLADHTIHHNNLNSLRTYLI